MQSDLTLDLEPISSGGFGSIYNCKYKGNKYVAKKIELLPNGFIDKPMEPIIMGTNIPHVNKHKGVLFDDSNIYILQDKGISLKAKRREGVPDYNTLIKWCKTLLTSIKHIHRYGFIHCDIKPDNILILDDQDESIVVADMGLLTIAQGKYEKSIGTTSYRAPEVWCKGDKSTSLDIWSLGLTIYFIIQGEDLFQLDTHISDKDHKKKLYKQQLEEWARCYSSSIKYGNFKLHKSHPLHSTVMSMLNPNPKERPSACDILRLNKFFSSHTIHKHNIPEIHVLNNIDSDLYVRWIYELIKKYVKDDVVCVNFSRWFKNKITKGSHIPIEDHRVEEQYRTIERYLVCSRCYVPKV